MHLETTISAAPLTYSRAPVEASVFPAGATSTDAILRSDEKSYSRSTRRALAARRAR